MHFFYETPLFSDAKMKPFTSSDAQTHKNIIEEEALSYLTIQITTKKTDGIESYDVSSICRFIRNSTVFNWYRIYRTGTGRSLERPCVRSE